MDAYLAVASQRDQREYAERPVPEEAVRRSLDAGSRALAQVVGHLLEQRQRGRPKRRPIIPRSSGAMPRPRNRDQLGRPPAWQGGREYERPSERERQVYQRAGRRRPRRPPLAREQQRSRRKRRLQAAPAAQQRVHGSSAPR